MNHVPDGWSAGSTYEEFMGRWSRRIVPEFLSWLQVPAGVHWLDVGCGTGALSDALCRLADPGSVVGCDPSEPFVLHARQNNGSELVSFEVTGVGSLPSRPGGFGSVTSSFSFNFFPDPAAALAEMIAIAGEGGMISACVWDYAAGMEPLRIFWDAVLEQDPNADDLDEGKRFPLCQPGPLTDLFGRSGLGDVCCEPIEVSLEFKEFAEFWQPFLGGTGPAPSYVASLEEESRRDLARMIDQVLPRRADGTIALKARAWAVKGIVG